MNPSGPGGGQNPFGPGGGQNPFGPGGPDPQRQPPPRRRNWLQRSWKWYDRYSTARDLRGHTRPRRSNDGGDSGGGGDGPGGGGGGGGGRGGGDGPGGGGGGRGGRGGGDGCGCDGCGCDLFYLSAFQVLLLAAPTRAPRVRVTVPGRAGVAAIRGYQRWLSHRLPTCCPHTPSCSHYGLAVVRRYGLLQGARLAGGRIARCTPTVPRGTADPPP